MSCATIEELFAFAHDQLPAVEAQRVRVHLGTACEECSRQLADVRRIIAAAKSHDVVETPEWLIHQAMNLFAWRRSKRRARSLRSIPALLLFDSGAGDWLLECRGAKPLTRHMLYRAGDYDIDLSIDYNQETRLANIIGQSMPVETGLEAVANRDVELLKECAVILATTTNRLGQFILDGVEGGVYDMRLKLESQEIEIVGLHAAA